MVESLRDDVGSEYDVWDFDCSEGSVNVTETGPSSIVIDHLVVRSDARRCGLGSVMVSAVLDVACEEEISVVEVEVQALDGGGVNDGVMEFFGEFGFEYVGCVETHHWGTCVQARMWL